MRTISPDSHQHNHDVLAQDCKFTVHDDVLPDGTHIPAGALVLYAPYVINRLPSAWGKDADVFRCACQDMVVGAACTLMFAAAALHVQLASAGAACAACRLS